MPRRPCLPECSKSTGNYSSQNSPCQCTQLPGGSAPADSKALGDPAGKLGLSCPFLYWEHPPCVQSPRDISEVRVGGGEEFIFGQLRHGDSEGVCLHLAWREPHPTPSMAHGPAPCSVGQSFVHFTSCVAGALLRLLPLCLSAQLQLDVASVHVPGLRPAGNTPLSPEPLPVNPRCVLEPRSYRVLPNEQFTGIAQSEGHLWHGGALTHSLGHTEPRDPAADPGLPAPPPCPSVRVSRQGA